MAKTNDRLAVVVGTGMWLVALVVLTIAVALVGDFSDGSVHLWLWTCAGGIALGAVGLLYTWRRPG